MTITAALVKDLRERTGAGMMECKKALVAAGGDIEAAVESMRIAGQAKADKRAGRAASEGLIAMAAAEDGCSAVMVEVNSETDFVSKGDEFKAFAAQIAARALASAATDLPALLEQRYDEGGAGTIEDRRKELIAKIGENITIRRMSRLEIDAGVVGTYLHGGRIGVLVSAKGADASVARDVAMHVAASRPVSVSEDDLPPGLLDKEKEIFKAQAAESGKPPEIVEKMVQGRLRKFVAEVTLLGQPFVKDPDLTVAKFVAKSGMSVESFVRFEVGEGVEKKTENFADEVMAQVKGAT